MIENISDLILGLPGDLPKKVIEEFRTGWHAQEFLAEQEQNEIARLNRECATINGLGQTVLQITPTAYHFWGQRLGYRCWADKAFRHEFARDNPEARVKYVPRGTSLRVNGRKGAVTG